MKSITEIHHRAAKLIWDGLGNQAVAKELGVSVSTVRNWKRDKDILALVNSHKKRHVEAESVSFVLAQQQAMTQRNHVYEQGELIYRLVAERLEVIEGNPSEPLPRGVAQWAELYLSHAKALGEIDYRILGMGEIIDAIKQARNLRSVQPQKSLPG